jgi:hypothetical protein
VAADFARHLLHDQGLAPIAVEEGYTRTARRFLGWRFGQGEVMPA